MRMRLCSFLLLPMLATPLAAQAQAPAPAKDESKLHPVAAQASSVAKLTFLAQDRRSLNVVDANGLATAIHVKSSDLAERLKAFHVGDVVRLSTVSDEGDHFLRTIEPIPASSSRTTRVVTLLVTLLLLLLVTALLYRGRGLGLILGADNRYSKSKFQMAVWFSTLVSSYLAAVYIRASASNGMVWGGIDIPQNLLLLSGLSALSFAGAKGITTSAVNRGAIAKTTGKPSFPGDLINADDGNPDFGDFQMLVVTALATFVYVGSVLAFLGQMSLAATVTLPDVDTTILGAFGLGQGAYLAKKAFTSGPPPQPNAQPAAAPES